MKKMIFSVPEKLAYKIDEAIERDGFVNRPDFFRYIAMRYIDSKQEVKDWTVNL